MKSNKTDRIGTGWWDVLFPTVFLLLTEASAVVLVGLVIGRFSGEYEIDAMAKEVTAMPLLVSITFYAGALLLQYKNFKVDEMRFGSSRNNWPVWKWAAACLTLVCAGHAWSIVLLHSGLTAVFTGYTTVGVKAFENQNLFLLLLSTVVLGPVCEEVFFRGMTFRRARAQWGFLPAAVLSSVLFGLYHMNVIQFLYACGIGLLLARIYQSSGDLRLPVLAHMCVNAWAIAADPFLEGVLKVSGTGLWITAAVEAVFAGAGMYLLIVCKSAKNTYNKKNKKN
ncbi:MAG: CPBP family intramembrane metalloprotease [Eubacteriales bacterium]|nr:CPBP family intramembrane metalloprotease [Eubacteriales bacterium]